MAYVTRAEIEALIPAAELATALKDPATGAETTGLMVALIAAADLDVDARLGGSYEVPFTGTVPALVRRAALVFTLESIWKRRGVSGDPANPWTREADRLRDRLDVVVDAGRMMESDALAASFGAISSVFSTTVDSRTTYNLSDETP
jgi:hypothetical protein